MDVRYGWLLGYRTIKEYTFVHRQRGSEANDKVNKGAGLRSQPVVHSISTVRRDQLHDQLYRIEEPHKMRGHAMAYTMSTHCRNGKQLQSLLISRRHEFT
jgi:hypothetical protein